MKIVKGVAAKEERGGGFAVLRFERLGGEQRERIKTIIQRGARRGDAGAGKALQVLGRRTGFLDTVLAGDDFGDLD